MDVLAFLRRPGPPRPRRRFTRIARVLLAVIVFVTAVSLPAVRAQSAGIGSSFGFTLGLGSQGNFSYVEAGVVMPKLADNLMIELKARAMSCLTWVPVLDPTLDPPAFHPVAVGGIITVGGCSPMFQGFYRAYGATDLFLGYTFTPYDSAIYHTANLIGPNLTFAVLGYFGLELFTGPNSSVFIDSGGGFKNFIVDKARKTDPYVVAASWIGSGFGIRMGTKLYM